MPRLLGLIAALLFALPVHAQDPPAEEAAETQDSETPTPPVGEESFFQKLDSVFGSTVVAPIGAFLFWDVVFWDNTLPTGEGLGLRGLGTGGDDGTFDIDRILTVEGAMEGHAQGYEVTGHDSEEGYAFQQVFQARQSEALPSPSEPAQRQFVHLQGQIQEVDGRLVAVLDPASLDPVALGLPMTGAGLPAGQKLEDYIGPISFVTEPEDRSGLWVEVGIEQFPVVVLPGENGLWEIIPTRFDIRPDLIPIEVGTHVRVGEVRAEVLSVNAEDDTFTLRSLQVFRAKGDLANPGNQNFPLVVLWLLIGATFFTLRMGFINIRGFTHSLRVTRGDYDNPDDPGEISHFQALSSALSATVGLGNIAGVAIAIGLGGPGALFWMIIAGFLGMSSKFTECSLGQIYRVVDDEGRVSGGPMRYLHKGLSDLGLPRLGKMLAIVFALMCIGGSLGGGNMFQANQSFVAVGQVVPILGGERATGRAVFHRATQGDLIPGLVTGIEIPAATKITDGSGREFRTNELVEINPRARQSPPVAVTAVDSGEVTNLPAGSEFSVAGIAGVSSASNPQEITGGTAGRAWLYGLVLSIFVGMVILGGIKRIGAAASRIVPLMCGIYVLAGLWIILVNFDQVGTALATIVREAFAPAAIGYGGLMGVLVQGFRRAAFSNEAGVGSAAIAHSAASTDEPIREGIVALIGPFIDTIVICTMTGLVVVIAGTYETHEAVLMTSAAFESVLPWFPLVLSFAVVMFAFSTMISWSYYGERCATYLFGPKASNPYKYLFLTCVFLGSVFELGNVLEFSDLMILGMAFPNILGVVMLSKIVRKRLDDYWRRLKAGEFDIAKTG